MTSNKVLQIKVDIDGRSVEMFEEIKAFYGLKTNAEIIGQENKLGTIEAGKQADLIVVDRDPLADITVLQQYLWAPA